MIKLICVNYNNNSDTLNFIESIFQTKPLQLEVCIVNNSAKSSSDKSFEDIQKKYNIEILNAPENPGYFGAAQLALSSFQNRIPNYDWIIVCNTDMHFKQKDFFSKLNQLKFSENIGLIGPSVISELSGKDTNPYLRDRPSKVKMHFYKIIFSNYFTCQAYQLLGLLKSKLQKTKKYKKENEVREIYAVHGSFMIFSRSYFEKSGNFKMGTYLYGEEIFCAEFLQKQLLKSLYVPDLEVIHKEHGSVGLFYSRKVIQFKKDSSQYLADTFFKD